jgi:Ca2+-binding EF-hand superfamily protein
MDTRQAYAMWDKSGKGFIDAKSMSRVMEAMGESFSEAEVNDMLRAASSSGRGDRVTQADFVRVLGKASRDAHDNSTGNVLKALDCDKDGAVSIGDLGAFFAAFGEEPSSEDLVTLFEQMKKEGGGESGDTISEAELGRYLSKA